MDITTRLQPSMEPLLKRPRLSLFADEPYNAELDIARTQNDLLLKSRFEAIFAKFSEDFSGVGDEIDLSTGTVIIDNGHLATMENEKDIGKPTPRSISPKDGKTVANGKSMLRAMTVAPARDDSFFEDEEADDVIHSIETIAGVIKISSDEDEDEDSEDVPMDEEGSASTRGQSSLLERQVRAPHLSLHSGEKDESDADSLFDVKKEYRESSVDSLFAVDAPTASAGLERNPEEREIIARFGETVGQEVLSFIENRDRAEPHIEPAWRIPVKIPEQPRSSIPRMDGTLEQLIEVRDSTGNTSTPNLPESSDVSQQLTPSPNKGKSLWKGPTRRTKSQIRRDEIWQRVRQESEDPLQDGFNSANGSTFEEDPDEEADLERCSRIIKRGICPWCKDQYNGRHRVLQHLRRIIRQHEKGEPTQGNHNLEHIIRVRPKIIEHDKVRGRGTRPSRLLICDFKSIVELHEAGGYSLDYIIAEKILHTKKQDVDKLRGLYERYRTVDDNDDDAYAEAFTRKEKGLITQLISKPLGTMDTIRRRMRTRGDKEIGDYLAETWLKECRSYVGIKAETLEGGIDEDEGAPERHWSEEEETWDADRGDEDSANDLFIGPSFPASGSGPFIKKEANDSDVDDFFVPKIW